MRIDNAFLLNGPKVAPAGAHILAALEHDGSETEAYAFQRCKLSGRTSADDVHFFLAGNIPEFVELSGDVRQHFVSAQQSAELIQWWPVSRVERTADDAVIPDRRRMKTAGSGQLSEYRFMIVKLFRRNLNINLQHQ